MTGDCQIVHAREDTFLRQKALAKTPFTHDKRRTVFAVLWLCFPPNAQRVDLKRLIYLPALLNWDSCAKIAVADVMASV
jgi:hypothetical protein